MKQLASFLLFLLILIFANPNLNARPLPSQVDLPTIVDGDAIRAKCMRRGTARLFDEDFDCIRDVIAGMPKLDSVRRELFGVQYDPVKFVECLSKGQPPLQWTRGCDRFLLQRRPSPEYWPYPEAKRPVLPAPELDKYYRPGIDPKEYYESLCKNVAGEFVLRVVKNVEGIYQIRPRPWADDYTLTDPYVLEDPYGYVEAEGVGKAEGILVASDRYSSLFVPTVAYAGKGARLWSGYEYSRLRGEATAPYFRIQRIADNDLRVSRTEVTTLGTQYGYVWRETTGVRERELGIAGGDLIAVDLRTGEVLGYLRGFTRSAITQRTVGGRNWRRAGACPLILSDRGRYGKDIDTPFWFLKKVLVPVSNRKGG